MAASVSEALCRDGNTKGAELLFGRLIDARSTAFWRSWTEAQTGHVGQMKEAARHMASAMEAYAGLYHVYWAVGSEAGKSQVKERMLLLQQRDPASRPRIGRK